MIAIQAAIAAAPTPTLSPLVVAMIRVPFLPVMTARPARSQAGCFPINWPAPVSTSIRHHQPASLPARNASYLDPTMRRHHPGADGRRASCAMRTCASRSPCLTAPPRPRDALVIYSHGTGGSYRSAVELAWLRLRQGLAAGGPAVATATLGLRRNSARDTQWGLHRGRRDVGLQFLNPRAARDNALQAAADLLAIRARSTVLPPSPSIPSRSIPRMWRCTDIRRAGMPLP